MLICPKRIPKNEALISQLPEMRGRFKRLLKRGYPATHVRPSQVLSIGTGHPNMKAVISRAFLEFQKRTPRKEEGRMSGTTSFYLHLCALGCSAMATASGNEATPSTVSTTVFVAVSMTEAELS